MLTFVTQRPAHFNNVSPSMSSNHEASFSLPSCSHATGWKSDLLHLPRRQRRRERERCISIIRGMCGLAEWTGRGKLDTFSSNTGRGEPIITSLLQSGAKISQIPHSSPEYRHEVVKKMSSLQFPPFAQAYRYPVKSHMPRIHYLLMTLHPSETTQAEQSEGVETGRFRGNSKIDGRKIGRSIITEDGCVPGAGGFQSGKSEIQFQAGTVEAPNIPPRGRVTEECTKRERERSWRPHTLADFHLTLENPRAGAWSHIYVLIIENVLDLTTNWTWRSLLFTLTMNHSTSCQRNHRAKMLHTANVTPTTQKDLKTSDAST